MYFDVTNNQWISGISEAKKFGEELKDVLKYKGVSTIPAGVIMVFTLGGKPYLMFQMLQDLVLSSVKNTTLLYYERGSIVFLGGDGSYIPTLRFRNCRFPTEMEFKQYERRATV